MRLILSGAAPLSTHVETFLRVVACAHVLQGYGKAIFNSYFHRVIKASFHFLNGFIESFCIAFTLIAFSISTLLQV